MARERQEHQAVAQWRQEQLIQAGLPPELAARVARDERYDLHQLIRLIEHGCAPGLAVSILEPIEHVDAA